MKIEDAIDRIHEEGIKCPYCKKQLRLDINFTLLKEKEDLKDE